MKFNEKEIPEIEELASSLGIKSYDLLIIGDGAGNFNETSCGWFCVCYDKNKKTVREHFGGTNGGTNNYAELEPGINGICSYRHTLYSHYVSNTTNKGEKLDLPLRCTIISDSEVTVRCGNKIYSRRSNAPLWASIEWLESKGYCLTWLHVPRNSNKFNQYADTVSKQIRKLFGELK